MNLTDGGFLDNETVDGDASGVAEVRSTTRMLPDGTFQVKSEHLKNGEWAPGRDTTYREDPSASVAFK